MDGEPCINRNFNSNTAIATSMTSAPRLVAALYSDLLITTLIEVREKSSWTVYTDDMTDRNPHDSLYYGHMTRIAVFVVCISWVSAFLRISDSLTKRHGIG